MATILRKTDIRLRVKMVGEFLILKLVKEDEIKCENRKKKFFVDYTREYNTAWRLTVFIGIKFYSALTIRTLQRFAEIF